MISPRQLAVLAAAGLAAGLFLAEPARALTAMAHPALIGFDQARLDALPGVQVVADPQRRPAGAIHPSVWNERVHGPMHVLH